MAFYLVLQIMIVMIIIWAVYPIVQLLKKESIQNQVKENNLIYQDGVCYVVVKQERLQKLLTIEKTVTEIVDQDQLDLIPDDLLIQKRPDWLVNIFAKTVYDMLCSDESPEDPEHNWEGWIANRLGIIHADLLSDALEKKSK